MAALKNIKLKILSYKKTGTVTHAMEAVSAVKMRKAQERALTGRAYAAAALSILERISGASEVKVHPLLQERSGKTCFVIITSDKGLAGSLNSAVVKAAEREIASRNLQKKDVIILAVGRRGGDFFASRGYDVRLKIENIGDNVIETDMRKVTDKIIELHSAGEIASCVVAYQNFLSTFEQEAGIRQIVPITQEMIAHMVAHIRPAKGRYAPRERNPEEHRPTTYNIEPDADTVLAELLPKLLNIAVLHALLEAKASEHSARMVAMKNATDKAKEKAQDLTRVFNKVRQAAITREVSEITSGIEAMR